MPELAAEGAEEYVRAILGELRELQGEEIAVDTETTDEENNLDENILSSD